jgi:hypothetical protein
VTTDPRNRTLELGVVHGWLKIMKHEEFARKEVSVTQTQEFRRSELVCFRDTDIIRVSVKCKLRVSGTSNLRDYKLFKIHHVTKQADTEDFTLCVTVTVIFQV